MPVYEFECQRCGTFEVVRPMAEVKGQEACPSCTGEAPRIFSAFGLLSGKSQGARGRSREGGEPRVVRKEVGAPREQAARAKSRAATAAKASPRATHTHGRPWMMGH